MATRRQAFGPQAAEGMIEDSSCILVEVALLGVSMSREGHFSGIESMDRMRTAFSAEASSACDSEDECYASRVRMRLEISDSESELAGGGDDGPQLQIEMDYSALFEVKGAAEAKALEYLDERAPGILLPHANLLVSDLLSHADLPPYSLQAANLLLPRRRWPASGELTTVQ